MSSSPPYVELHCHSAYSFLDGASLPEELAQRAGELGHTALALTDHNSVSGSMELAQIASDCGIRAIHGAELDVLLEGPAAYRPGVKPTGAGGRARAGRALSGAPEPTRHITLLVKDERGWRNLCRIITLAHVHTRNPPSRGAGGSGRRDLGEPAVALADVLDHAEGLVCLTGCAERSLVGEGPPAGAAGAAGATGAAGAAGMRAARGLLEAFGQEDLYVELQRPYARDDRARNRAFAAVARQLGIRCVATGNVHAHAACRAELQDVFVALRNHTTLDASEPLRRGNRSHVMTTPQAMASRLADHPEAVRETLLLAERLSFDLLEDLGYRYPGAEEQDASRRLAELCSHQLQERYGERARGERAEAQGRLEDELRVIDRLGLAGFFLLHHEMLELAREVALEVRGAGGLDSPRALLAPGRGRGSSVSSLVCYLTGLSHIDPVASKLALGRFLHEDLHGLPDIDLDFPRDIRERLIPRVHDRFGRDRAALVAAFPTFRSRGAIRELGKVLGLPPGEIERLARSADTYMRPDGHDGWEGHSSPEMEGSPEMGGSGPRSSRWAWLSRLVQEAYGLPRHLSQHSGGMIIATRPLIDCCPVVPAAMEGRQMVQWDKDSCGDAGFLKIDLLGLGMLSAVERCVDEIWRERRERIDLTRIPYDDACTFRAIRSADTVGVFQIESRAQMQSLLRTRPRNLEDLTIQVAIVRPGPIQGGAVNPYIERRQRLREDPSFQIPYEHPSLEPVLKETLGTIIFQDQVMQVAEVFAGYTPGEADGLRRAMSRKRSHEKLQRHRERFVAGAIRHSGADAEQAERVWGMVVGFAGFGFPKAHSAAFGLLAYQSTWLRVHYGAEFLCALLNEQPMGFYAPDSLIHEAEKRPAEERVEVLGVDVNASQVQCAVQRGAVRLGLGYVKQATTAEMEALVAERERGGPYRSIGELASRSGCRRVTLEQLAWSGACDALLGVEEGAPPMSGGRQASRRTALWQLGMASPALALGLEQEAEASQLALPLELPEAPPLRHLGRWQRLIADYSTSGVTIGDHVIAALRERLTVPKLATSAQLARLPSGGEVAVAGLVIARQKPGTANGTMFLLFEDEFGTINLIVPRDVYERCRHLARAEPLLLARGRLERHQEGADSKVRRIHAAAGYAGPAAPHAPGVPSAADVPSAAAVPHAPATPFAPRRAADGVWREAGGEEIRPVINVLVRELEPLERFIDGHLEERSDAARVRHLPARAPVPRDGALTPDGAEVASSMRAVAPPIQSFAAGRRR